jgi:hypothetical protein
MATLSTFLATHRTGSRAVKKTVPSKARIETHGKYTWVETGVRCPACNQELSYDPGEMDAVECGGPGNGACSESIVAFSLGTPKWDRECEEFKLITEGARLPSLETCLKVQPAINKAAAIGEEVWASRGKGGSMARTGAPSARYIVATVHDGTDYGVFKASAEDIRLGDDMSHEQAVKTAKRSAANQKGARWYDFGDTEYNEE